MKRHNFWLGFKLTVFSIVVLIGLGIFAYPTASSIWNEYVATKLLSEYTEVTVESETISYDNEIARAMQYNLTLPRNTSVVTAENAKTNDFDYEQCLNLQGTGVMGYIELPDISQRLPIYHYSDENSLTNGIGHLHGSSLPIGGEGSNCVLTGHRGVPNNLLFTRLDEIKNGSYIFLHILDQNLAYQVVKIFTVLPEEVDQIRIPAEGDYVTLITCTPYGINSHRLIIMAERTEMPEDYEEVSDVEVVLKAVNPWKLIVSIVFYAIFLALIMRKYEKEKIVVLDSDSDRNHTDDSSVSNETVGTEESKE